MTTSGRSDNGLGFILVTHGDVGASLLATAEYILGRRLTNFVAVKVPFMSELRPVLEPDDPLPFARRRELIAARIRQARDQVDRGGGIVVLADLVGGTSCTVAREIVAPQGGIIVAGVNLPMLLKAAELPGCSAAEAGLALVERSRRAIVCLLPKEGGGREEESLAP
jgi:PTS system mannose-specific IIA component